MRGFNKRWGPNPPPVLRRRGIPSPCLRKITISILCFGNSQVPGTSDFSGSPSRISAHWRQTAKVHLWELAVAFLNNSSSTVDLAFFAAFFFGPFRFISLHSTSLGWGGISPLSYCQLITFLSICCIWAFWGYIDNFWSCKMTVMLLLYL